MFPYLGGQDIGAPGFDTSPMGRGVSWGCWVGVQGEGQRKEWDRIVTYLVTRLDRGILAQTASI